jgi:hypothetical protein
MAGRRAAELQITFAGGADSRLSAIFRLSRHISAATIAPLIVALGQHRQTTNG